MNRPPSRPPDLAGYTSPRLIGGGGFADVFLYHQTNLDRDVAVKVLLAADSSPAARRRFESEGQIMARLSEEHQNIVPVYDAAICSDGRPYLVMQYCPLDDLAKRYKTAPIPVSEVLSIGVQLAGAVESAHRQQILHRDIKPANVLTKRSGRPALTDFGISVATTAADDPESVGVSIPWSPPELLADNPKGDVRSDVYSLTATLYTLLARRSPFEIPGKTNDLVDLLSRIPRMPAPATGNPQTPRSLERVLARGLAKDPDLRYPSAMVLARALQAVETEVNGAVTNFEFLAENPGAVLAELPTEQADHTRIRPIVIRPHTATNPPRPHDSTTMRGSSGTTGDVTSLRPQPMDRADHTQLRGRQSGGYLDPQYLNPPTPDRTFVPARPAAVSVQPVEAPRKSRVPLVVAGAVGVLVAGTLTWIVVSNGTDAPAIGTDTSSTTTPALAVELVVPAPVGLTGVPSGGDIVFTWTNPDPQAGDTYDWQRTDLDPAPDNARVDATTVTVTGATTACIDVQIVRENGQYSAEPAQACGGQ